MRVPLLRDDAQCGRGVPEYLKSHETAETADRVVTMTQSSCQRVTHLAEL
jgi:hypothetical protein